MKNLIVFSPVLMMLLSGCNKYSETKYFDYPISAVPVRNVELTDSFWLPKIRLIQQKTIQYAFEKCKQEGRMDNFLIAGKKMKGTTKGKMPFDDTDLYKIIEGASYSLISHADPALEAYLDSVIAIIKQGQEPDGYLATWFTIDREHPPAPWVKPSKYRWENEISSHELYNSGHLFEAAAAHYLATGNRNFLDIALKNADLLVENFGPGKNYTVPGHQIVETGLIKLYRITNKTKYLELAKFFLDERGDSLHHNLYGAYNQDHKPVVQQDEVVGHAVRAVYMYAAMTDIAAIYHDAAYRNAVEKLWDNMVNKKLYITGGIGARHEGESFGDNYELPNLKAYSETCAAIGSVYWNQRLFLLDGNAKYYDIIERTLNNGLIAGLSTDGTEFFYPNPLESDGKYAFNMGACTREKWFDCSCCPTNLIRFIPSIPGLIYATRKDTLYTNLYMSNQAKIKINGKLLEIKQETNYPWSDTVRLSITTTKKMEFTMKLRVPYWLRNQPVPGSLYYYNNSAPDKIILSINGIQQPYTDHNGYIDLTRSWSKGDIIELYIPMRVRLVKANELVADDNNKAALEYGPFVFCAEEIDNGKLPDQFKLSDSTRYIPAFRKDLFNGTEIITAKNMEHRTGIHNKGHIDEIDNLTLIPYYLWSNRGVGEMKVWFPIEQKVEE
jgi:uncharacterized protein